MDHPPTPGGSEGAGAVGMGHRGRESAKQQSGAPGAVQHSAVGPARLAQGLRSTEAVQVLESQTPGSRSRMCDAPICHEVMGLDAIILVF